MQKRVNAQGVKKKSSLEEVKALLVLPGQEVPAVGAGGTHCHLLFLTSCFGGPERAHLETTPTIAFASCESPELAQLEWPLTVLCSRGGCC